MARPRTTQKDQIQALLKETIMLLCRNGLTFETDISVEALVGITVDNKEVILVSLKETINYNQVTDQPCCCAVNSKTLGSSQKDTTTELKGEVPQCHFGQKDTSNVDTNENSYQHTITQHITDTDSIQPCTSGLQEPFTNRKFDGTNGLHVSPTHPFLHSHKRKNIDPCDASKALRNTSEVQINTNQHKKSTPCPSISSRSFNSHCSDTQFSTPDTESGVGSKRRRQYSDANTYSPQSATSDMVDNDDDMCLQMEEDSSDVVFVKEEVGGSECDAGVSFLNTSDAALGPSESVHDADTICSPGSECTPEDQISRSIKPICQSVMKYEGWCVPLRDIHRLRLTKCSSAVIRIAMESLEKSNLGRIQEFGGNMCVFYKCPPHLVDRDALAKYDVLWADYSTIYARIPAPNSTNCHSDHYWRRVIEHSPYSD